MMFVDRDVTCKVCQKIKPRSSFPVVRGKLASHTCKECTNDKRRERYYSDAEYRIKAITANKKYASEHKDKYKDRSKQYQKEYREKARLEKLKIIDEYKTD